MAALRIEFKHPAEMLDYDLPFSDWLASHSTTVDTWTAAADTGITLVSAGLVSDNIRVRLSQGTSGRAYRIAGEVLALDGQIKREELIVRVRGRPTTGGGTSGSGGLLSLDGAALTLDGAALSLA
jgi:hypothetical protein